VVGRVVCRNKPRPCGGVDETMFTLVESGAGPKCTCGFTRPRIALRLRYSETLVKVIPRLLPRLASGETGKEGVDPLKQSASGDGAVQARQSRVILSASKVGFPAPVGRNYSIPAMALRKVALVPVANEVAHVPTQSVAQVAEVPSYTQISFDGVPLPSVVLTDVTRHQQ